MNKLNRDWNKYPSNYERMTDPNILSIALIEISVILRSKLSDLDKLDCVRRMTWNFDKEYINSYYFSDFVLTGRAKPRNKKEKQALKEHKNKLSELKRLAKKKEKENEKYKIQEAISEKIAKRREIKFAMHEIKTLYRQFEKSKQDLRGLKKTIKEKAKLLGKK